MNVKGRQTLGLELPCHSRKICTSQIKQLDLAIQAITLSLLKTGISDQIRELALQIKIAR
jgi:hypothetical protein